MTPIHRILVATDFSAFAKRAVDCAAELSSALGAPLVIVHVYTSPAIATPDGFMLFTPVDVEEMLETGLADEKQRARGLGARDVETVLIQGTAWREIVRVAADRGCDLIVIGAHGRSGLSDFLLGSVAEKLVRKADCAVMTVRAAE